MLSVRYKFFGFIYTIYVHSPTFFYLVCAWEPLGSSKSLPPNHWIVTHPRCSMYGIFTYIHLPQKWPSFVGKYSIYRTSGYRNIHTYAHIHTYTIYTMEYIPYTEHLGILFIFHPFLQRAFQRWDFGGGSRPMRARQPSRPLGLVEE